MIPRPPISTLFPYTTLFRSQEALAQMTSMASFTVCRILTNWENQGLLKLRREVIEVHNVAGLLRSEEHTSELQSLTNLVCRLLLEKKKEKDTCYTNNNTITK